MVRLLAELPRVVSALNVARRVPQRRARIARKSRQSGLATTLALVACGYLDEGNACGPLNAVSHMVWGEDATRQQGFSVKYTVVGALLNGSSVGGWAALHDMACGESEARGEWIWPTLGAVGVAALAWFVDYKVVPRRLQPGFENRVSRRSMWLLYGALALALAGSSWHRAKR